MKKPSVNFKYLIFSFSFVFAIFVFVKPTYADSYTHVCSDGSTIIASISGPTPASPYTVGSTTSFSVTATTSSTCPTRNVSLTIKHNTSATETLISGTIGPGYSNSFPKTYTPASSSPGTYYVTLTLGVDEPQIVYARIISTPVSTTDSTFGPYNCGGSSIEPLGQVIYFSRTDSTYEVRFYSDSAGTVPKNVTGLGLTLERVFHTYGGNPPYETYASSNITPSGTYHSYTNAFYESFTDQYGSDSCDKQLNNEEYNITGGAGLTFIP